MERMLSSTFAAHTTASSTAHDEHAALSSRVLCDSEGDMRSSNNNSCNGNRGSVSDGGSSSGVNKHGSSSTTPVEAGSSSNGNGNGGRGSRPHELYSLHYGDYTATSAAATSKAHGMLPLLGACTVQTSNNNNSSVSKPYFARSVSAEDVLCSAPNSQQRQQMWQHNGSGSADNDARAAAAAAAAGSGSAVATLTRARSALHTPTFATATSPPLPPPLQPSSLLFASNTEMCAATPTSASSPTEAGATLSADNNNNASRATTSTRALRATPLPRFATAMTSSNTTTTTAAAVVVAPLPADTAVLQSLDANWLLQQQQLQQAAMASGVQSVSAASRERVLSSPSHLSAYLSQQQQQQQQQQQLQQQQAPYLLPVTLLPAPHSNSSVDYHGMMACGSSQPASRSSSSSSNYSLHGDTPLQLARGSLTQQAQQQQAQQQHLHVAIRDHAATPCRRSSSTHSNASQHSIASMSSSSSLSATAAAAAAMTHTSAHAHATATSTTAAAAACEGEATVDVYDPEFKDLLAVPASRVYHRPHPSFGVTRLVLCRNYLVGNAASCSKGEMCKFVHADVTGVVRRSIHVNYAWRRLDMCTYARLPPGEVLVVLAPNERQPSELIPSERILVTRGSVTWKEHLSPLSHCAHYYFNRMCNRGERCNFIHSVYVDPLVQGDYKRAPAPTSVAPILLAAPRATHPRAMLASGSSGGNNNNNSNRRGSRGEAMCAGGHGGGDRGSDRSVSHNNDTHSDLRDASPYTLVHIQQQQQQQQQQVVYMQQSMAPLVAQHSSSSSNTDDDDKCTLSRRNSSCNNIAGAANVDGCDGCSSNSNSTLVYGSNGGYVVSAMPQLSHLSQPLATTTAAAAASAPAPPSSLSSPPSTQSPPSLPLSQLQEVVLAAQRYATDMQQRQQQQQHAVVAPDALYNYSTTASNTNSATTDMYARACVAPPPSSAPLTMTTATATPYAYAPCALHALGGSGGCSVSDNNKGGGSSSSNNSRYSSSNSVTDYGTAATIATPLTPCYTVVTPTVMDSNTTALAATAITTTTPVTTATTAVTPTHAAMLAAATAAATVTDPLCVSPLHSPWQVMHTLARDGADNVRCQDNNNNNNSMHTSPAPDATARAVDVSAAACRSAHAQLTSHDSTREAHASDGVGVVGQSNVDVDFLTVPSTSRTLGSANDKGNSSNSSNNNNNNNAVRHNGTSRNHTPISPLVQSLQSSSIIDWSFYEDIDSDAWSTADAFGDRRNETTT